MTPPPPPDTSGFVLDRFLPYLLSAANNRLSRLFAQRHLAEFDLTIPEWRVLATIGCIGTTGATAIAGRTAMDKVKVSRAVAGLLHRGLLRRTPDPADGRAWLLSLTRRGRTIHDRIVPRALAFGAELTAAIPPAELDVFRSVLARLGTRMAELGGGEPESVARD
jgi:DNA-binding MarR family transcriptional regulator